MEHTLPLTMNYGEVIRRRLPLSVAVAAALLIVTVAIALGLPAIYRSRAVILIEQQDIPQDLVRSLVTSYADQRIQVISQRVLTNANLSEIIERFALYATERETEPLEMIIARMREDITVAPISADVVDQKSGRATKATIAVEIAFNNENPTTAQRVANDLVSLFLNENLKQRTEATEETLNFLSTESERLKANVADLETRLAAFKESHAGALPELAALNLQVMSRIEQEMIQVQNQIRSLEQQRVYLESELAQQKPMSELLVSESGERILGPADRLRALESEYITLSARYGDTHPDVVRMKREIDSLRNQTPGGEASSEMEARLRELRSERAVNDERYGAEHPENRRLDREIAKLEDEVARARAAQESGARPANANNPAYIQLAARLDATVADLRSLQGQQVALRDKMAAVERQLGAAPQVEREYRALTREHELAVAKYQEVLAKKQEAELARSLESEQKGERFILIEPPVVPEQPDRPNRLAIGLLGLVLSLASSVAVAAMTESLDGRIYGRSGVARVLGQAPLAVIPRLENAASRRARKMRRLLVAAGLLAAVVIVVVVAHLAIGPLDVLYFRAMRVLGM